MIIKNNKGLVDETKLEKVEREIFIQFLLFERARHQEDIDNIDKTIVGLQYRKLLM